MARPKKDAAPDEAADGGIVPASDFSFVYHNHLLDFKAGVKCYPEAQLLAALKAANAPLKD